MLEEIESIEFRLTKAEQAFADKSAALDAELSQLRSRLEARAAVNLEEKLDKFATELLPALDALESLRDHDRENSDLRAVWNLFEQRLKSLGVERFVPSGKFDPDSSNAVSLQETVPELDGAVIYVSLSGYRRAGHLLRPAQVVVGRASATPRTVQEPRVEEGAPDLSGLPWSEALRAVKTKFWPIGTPAAEAPAKD